MGSRLSPRWGWPWEALATLLLGDLGSNLQTPVWHCGTETPHLVGRGARLPSELWVSMVCQPEVPRGISLEQQQVFAWWETSPAPRAVEYVGTVKDNCSWLLSISCRTRCKSIRTPFSLDYHIEMSFKNLSFLWKGLHLHEATICFYLWINESLSCYWIAVTRSLSLGVSRMSEEGRLRSRGRWPGEAGSVGLARWVLRCLQGRERKAWRTKDTKDKLHFSHFTFDQLQP